MHTNKVLHRDLKTQNVFMLGNGRLVLGDLGISKVSCLYLHINWMIIKESAFLMKIRFGMTLSQY